MALDKKNLLTLMKIVAKADNSAPTSYSWNGESFSYENLQDTLRKELNEYAGSYSLYRENKNLMSFGTIRPPSVVQAVFSAAHEESSDGATRADAPPMAIVFRKSLRSAIVCVINYF